MSESTEPQYVLTTNLLARSEARESISHYTSADGLLGILSKHALWATDVRFLNDSGEFVYAVQLAERAVDSREIEVRNRGGDELLELFRRGVRLASKPRVYVVSFCESGDLLSQWRAYGTGGGFSLGISPLVLMKLLASHQDPAVLLKCVYSREEQDHLLHHALTFLLGCIEERVATVGGDRGKGLDDVGRQFFGHLLVLASAFKNPRFAEENEWRAIIRQRLPSKHVTSLQHRAARGRIVPFTSIPVPENERVSLLRDIVVGPSRGTDLGVTSAAEFALSQGYSPTVRPSEIPFRDW